MEDEEVVAAPDEVAGRTAATQAAAAPAGTSLGKRKPGRPALHHGCQVCGAALDHLKLFHQRYHICIDCMALEKVQLKGVDCRFCQQCGRFHELDAFGPGMRSCRKQLAKHAERRRRARELAALAAGKDNRRRSGYAQRVAAAAAAAQGAVEAGAGYAAEAQAEAKRSRGQEEGMGEAPQPLPSLDQLMTHPRLPPLPWPLPDAGSGSAGSTAHLVPASGDAGGLAALVAAAEGEQEGGGAGRDSQQQVAAAASAALPPLQPPQPGAPGWGHAQHAQHPTAWAASAGSLFGGVLQLPAGVASAPAQPLLVRSHSAGPQHDAQAACTPQQVPPPPQQQQQAVSPGEQKLLDFFGMLSALGGAPAAAPAQPGAAAQQAAWQPQCGLSPLAAAHALSQAAVEHTQRRAEQQQQQQQQQHLIAALAALAPPQPSPPAAPPAVSPLQQLLLQLGQQLGQPSAPAGQPPQGLAPPAPSHPQPPPAAMPTPPAATQHNQGGSGDPSAALFQSAVGGLLLSILNSQQR